MINYCCNLWVQQILAMHQVVQTAEEASLKAKYCISKWKKKQKSRKKKNLRQERKGKRLTGIRMNPTKRALNLIKKKNKKKQKRKASWQIRPKKNKKSIKP